ncbi:MAG: hypothetical protein U0324_17780 [Polyangiales bacterium]
MTLPRDTLHELEQLAHRLPERTAGTVVHLFRDPDGAKKLRETFQLVEFLTMELLDRLNSVIVASAPRPSSDLLRVLFEFARKETQQFSLGDRAKSIAAFARFFGARDAPPCEAFPDAVSVLVSPLPDATIAMVRRMTVAREGRREFDIPAARVAAYVAKNMGSPRALRLADLTNEFVQWRNADAHVDHDADTSKRWFQGVAKDPVWLSTLAGWLDEGVAALLLWQPLSALLTGTVVRSLRHPATHGTDAWSAEIVPAMMQIVAERAVGRGAVWEGTADWWVMPRPSDASSPKALCLKVPWPTAPAPSTEAVSRYKSQVALAWLEVGYMPEDRRGAIETAAREGLLPDRQSAEIRDSVGGLVARTMRGDQEAQGELARLVPDEVLARLPLDALGSRRADAIFALIEADWPVTTAHLANTTALPPEDLAEVLRELEMSQRITRRAGGEGEEVRPRWKELTDAAKLLDDLAHQRRLSDNDRRLSACVVALARLLDERFRDPFDAPGPEEALHQPWVLPINGHLLVADTLEALCDNLARNCRERGRWEAFVASLPWRAPGGNTLLAWSEGAQQVEVKTTGISRAKAMYALESGCAALGWLTVPEERDPADAEEGEISLWIEVRATADEPWTRIGGGSVRAFLGRLTRWLALGGHLDPERLPVASGHSRYLLNSEPLHVSGGSYLSPLHCLPGVYVETHNSRSGALSAARKVCTAMRVAVRDANDIAASIGHAHADRQPADRKTEAQASSADGHAAEHPVERMDGAEGAVEQEHHVPVHDGQ